MSISADTFRSLVNGYIGMSNRWVFTSVLRQRNARFEEPFNQQGNIAGIQSLGPAFPFTLLINPKEYNYTSWKNISTTNQGLDGPMEYFTSNVDLPTLHASGSSGDLQLISNAFNDPKALALFNQQLEPGFEDILINNHGIDFVANGTTEATNQLLEQFYRMMGAISNTKNVKIKTFLQLKSWCDEPNVVSTNVETFHNLKRIIIFSNLYPLGKTYWGIVDGGISYNNDWETFRHVEWDFNFKIIKETRNDLDFDGVKPPAIFITDPIPTPKPPDPKPNIPPQIATVPNNPVKPPTPPGNNVPPPSTSNKPVPTPTPKPQVPPPNILIKKTDPPKKKEEPPPIKKKLIPPTKCGATKILNSFVMGNCKDKNGNSIICRDAGDQIDQTVFNGSDIGVKAISLNRGDVHALLGIDKPGNQGRVNSYVEAFEILSDISTIMTTVAPCCEDISLWMNTERRIKEVLKVRYNIFGKKIFNESDAGKFPGKFKNKLLDFFYMSLWDQEFVSIRRIDAEYLQQAGPIVFSHSATNFQKENFEENFINVKKSSSRIFVNSMNSPDFTNDPHYIAIRDLYVTSLNKHQSYWDQVINDNISFLLPTMQSYIESNIFSYFTLQYYTDSTGVKAYPPHKLGDESNRPQCTSVNKGQDVNTPGANV